MNEKQSILDKEFEELSTIEKQKIKNIFENPEERLQTKILAEKLLFTKRPPTPQEFLDPREGWLHKSVIKDLFPHVIEDFCDIIENSKKYQIVSLYGCTRQGKSMLTRLIILYTQIFINHLRDPHAYFNIPSMSNLTQYLICFKYDKTKELLTSPIFQLMESSERFIKVKMKDQVQPKQNELGPDYFVYSKAATTGEITNTKGFNMHLGNKKPSSLLGADIIQAFITEIAFFIEEAGATEEDIFRLFTDAVDRIEASVGVGTYLSFTLLDTSANHADSIIEKHILQNLKDNPKVFFKSRSRWEANPKNFPVWQKTGKTFKICTGDGSNPAKIIKNKKELLDTPKNLLMDIPIDVKDKFEASLTTSIKNIAGKPTSNESKLIQDGKIIEKLFEENLDNIEDIIIADSKESPKDLIFSKVKNKFFVNADNKKLILKRAPKEPRFIHLDPAFSSKGDVYGFAMLHKELDEKNDIKYITDMAFPIGPGKNGINLTSVEEFILDLIIKGGVNIIKVTSDSFQNKQLQQNLDRLNINIETLSVDRDITQYMNLINLLYTGKIKTGKNIFLKNNLDSLMKTTTKSGKEKIDHTIGTTNNIYNGSWSKSTAGIYAKDVSDCVCGALWSACNHVCLPQTSVIIENKRVSEKQEDIKELVEEAFSQINTLI